LGDASERRETGFDRRVRTCDALAEPASVVNADARETGEVPIQRIVGTAIGCGISAALLCFGLAALAFEFVFVVIDAPSGQIVEQTAAFRQVVAVKNALQKSFKLCWSVIPRTAAKRRVQRHRRAGNLAEQPSVIRSAWRRRRLQNPEHCHGVTLVGMVIAGLDALAGIAVISGPWRPRGAGG